MIILAGSYPRSEKLIQATRDFDRNRISLKELKSLYNLELDNLIELQKKAECEFYSNGLFKYQDLLRPLCSFIDNCRAESLVRFEETNMFWRKIHIKKLDINPSNFSIYLEEYLDIGKMGQFNYLVSLPAPLTLRKYSNLKTETSIELISHIAQKLEQEWIKISQKSLILAFIEYTPVTKIKPIVDLCRRLQSLKSTKFVLFKNKIQNYKDLEKLEVDGIGLNFYKNPIKQVEQINLNKFQNLILGVINTNTTLLEDREKLIEFIEYVRKFYHGKIYLSDDFCAELLPQEVMNQKILNIADLKFL
ncbi:MAG: hypothetical protein ABDH21_03070 [bacterium]